MANTMAKRREAPDLPAGFWLQYRTLSNPQRVGSLVVASRCNAANAASTAAEAERRPVVIPVLGERRLKVVIHHLSSQIVARS